MKAIKTISALLAACALTFGVCAFAACSGDDDSHTHTWDSGEVTKAATCTETGTMTYTCTECNETKTETIAATGHTWGDWEVTTAATCGTAGEQTRTCSVCKTSETEAIAATGNHTWDDGEEQEDGSILYTCTVCGETKTEGGSSSSSGTTEGTTGEKTAYTFEAEYTDLWDHVADGSSGTVQDGDLIYTGQKFASGEAYVFTDMTGSDNAIVFYIVSSAETTADLSIVVRNESGTHIVSSDYLQVDVNGTKITYAGSNATNGSEKIKEGVFETDYFVFDTIEVGTVQLKEGANVISFEILSGSSSSDTLRLDFDCMILESEAELSWNEEEGYPITDWDTWYDPFA